MNKCFGLLVLSACIVLQSERAWKAVERLSSTRQGGLMTDLGLMS